MEDNRKDLEYKYSNRIDNLMHENKELNGQLIMAAQKIKETSKE